MNPNTFPTKGNLILAKNSLALAKQGYVLMDKKRNILIRELMDLIDQARDIQSEIDSTFREAYESLQKANIELGINYVQEISSSIPIENGTKKKWNMVVMANWKRAKLKILITINLHSNFKKNQYTTNLK